MNKKQAYISLLKEAIPYIRKEFGVKQLMLFGSVARNEDKEDSDIDIFVDMPPKAFKFVELQYFLQELLGNAVDLVRNHSHLDPFLSNEIKRDGIAIILNE